MKHTLLLFATTLLLSIQSYAQTGVAINTTGAKPDNSAMLDVSSSSKGMLIPRMTRAGRGSIASPAEGLMIFQTNETTGFYFYQSTWKFVGTGLDYSQLTSKPGNATPSTAGFMSAADKTKLDATASGTAPIQMQYWNGTNWVIITAGQNSQILKYKNGIPTWDDDNIEYLSIGDFYKGGIIAYFLHSGDPGYDANVRHGIIAAPSDLGDDSPWGCRGFPIAGADGTALGTGNQNTIDIEAGCNTVGIAAHQCSQLELNGYSDWYLPSLDELTKLFDSKDAVGVIVDDTGYWSSSEASAGFANKYSYNLGAQAITKDANCHVRAVRSF